MKKLFFIAVTLLSCLIAGEVRSQDFHFSQFDMVSLYMNPATTGMYDGEKGDYRIASDFRSQWHALGIKPFTTAYVSYDMPLQKYYKKWGCGGYIVEDHSGVGKYQTLNVMGSGAYNIMDGTKEHYLSVGLQMGIFYKSFNPADYTYDVQWDNTSGTFDTNIDNQEPYEKNGIVRFDAAMGVRYKYMPTNQKYHPSASLSLNHLSMPKESFTGMKSRVPIRFNFQTTCMYDIDESFSVEPRILYMNQKKAHELDFGCLVYYNIPNSSLDALGGIDYRTKDALIFHIGFKQDRSIFRFSYDLNTSFLKNYSSGRGAWEFSIIIVGQKDKPIFMPLF